MSAARQTVVGVTLAVAIVGGWAAIHVYGVFFHEWSRSSWLIAPLLVLAQTWLGAGMFITAHDAMHGSLAPGRPGLNGAVGGVAVALYAGFSYGRLHAKHHEHHGAPGTAADPDFHAERPGHFWPWFVRFFRTYFGLRELVILAAVVLVYELVLGASPANVLVFWAAPALLSALQLFTFGTWLPHRHGDDFADEHRARSNTVPRWLSLLTCFHFGGYHHEHHTRPHLPWWRLPEARR